MQAKRFLSKSVVVRELLPQDLKIELASLTSDDLVTRKSWQTDLLKNRSKSLDAPSWLWRGTVDLLISHEGAYLEHCGKYALANS